MRSLTNLPLKSFPRVWCTDNNRLALITQYRQYATRPKHRHTRNTYFYDVLGVPSSASQSQIKNAYIELTKKHHPDVSGSEDSRVKFQLIADAYSVLGNVHSRRMYDRGLVSGTRQQSHSEKEVEFDPFALPVKPVQTELDKITRETYRAITEKRILHSSARARQRQQEEQ
jgi:DnaJ family protein C protein 30